MSLKLPFGQLIHGAIHFGALVPINPYSTLLKPTAYRSYTPFIHEDGRKESQLDTCAEEAQTD